jgi:hypothetical protein
MNATQRLRSGLVVLSVALVVTSRAAGINLGSNVVVSFASADAGRHLLTNRDEFITALSPFDRAGRMKTDRAVSEKEFLAFLQQSVLSWAPEETERIGGVLKTLGDKCARWPLPFPTNIVLIKTSGQEEGNACYTRQNAIVLPVSEARSAPADLEGVLAHELFHILSRHNPGLRESLYGVIGFSRIDEFALPDELRARQLTNPDGVDHGWSINVTNDGRALTVAPVLYSSQARYDAKKEGEIFDYLAFRLLEVEKADGRWRPKLVSGRPHLLEPRQVSGFYEQVGANSHYDIHPDEILAVNFVWLLNGEDDLRPPRIIAGMKKVLRGPAR